MTVYFQEIVEPAAGAGAAAAGAGAAEDAYSVVPGSQFTVTRTATRANASSYYINGALSSFAEATTLLKGRGIDLDNNRFLILQGEVRAARVAG